MYLKGRRDPSGAEAQRVPAMIPLNLSGFGGRIGINMKHTFFGILLLLIMAAGIAAHLPEIPGAPAQPPSAEIQHAKSFFPGARKVVPVTTPPPHLEVYGREGTPAGYAFHTAALAPDVQGYAGPIDLLIGIDLTGTIVGIQVVSHRETSAYVRDLNGFLKQFLNRGPADPLVLGETIDGISQATITSSAVTRAVEESRARMVRDILKLQAAGRESPRAAFPVEQILVPGLLFVLAGSGAFFRSPPLRWMALCGGLLYLGLVKKTMVAAAHVANIGILNLPSFADSPLWYALMSGTFLSCLLGGMLYCGSVCPFAAVQELLYTIGKRIHRGAFLPSPRIDSAARLFKYTLLSVILAASLYAANPDIANVEVYVTLFTGYGSRLAWTLVGIMLIAGTFHYRFWCKYFCPIGALTGILSQRSLFRIRVNDACNGCQQCQALCPTQAIKTTPLPGSRKVTIETPECILCMKCVRECPKGALRFSYDQKEEK